jgi:site-specific DNA-methyltransferase (adenine-specific)/adenine-specific DNA-methyltransferase
MPNLTKYQRQHIIELLERGKDLPLDYKHLLFPPERKEYELVYAGKEREEDILAGTMAVPLQPIKTFGGNGDPSAGSGQSGWHNMLIFGDNLQAMKGATADEGRRGTGQCRWLPWSKDGLH